MQLGLSIEVLRGDCEGMKGFRDLKDIVLENLIERENETMKNTCGDAHRKSVKEYRRLRRLRQV